MKIETNVKRIMFVNKKIYSIIRDNEIFKQNEESGNEMVSTLTYSHYL